MADPLVLQAVAPLSVERTQALVKHAVGGCKWEWIDAPTYPKPSIDLREIRMGLGLSMGAAGRALGLRASEVSGIEEGRLVPAAGLDNYIARLRAVREVPDGSR